MEGIERLPRHIRRNFIQAPSGCWIWMRYRDKDGYGLTSLARKTVRAHRATYSLLTGEIPAGLQIDHLCRVRRCVNPLHLQPVTSRVNSARAGHHMTWKRCRKCGGEFRHITYPSGDSCRLCWPCYLARKRVALRARWPKVREVENRKRRERYWAAKNAETKP